MNCILIETNICEDDTNPQRKRTINSTTHPPCLNYTSIIVAKISHERDMFICKDGGLKSKLQRTSISHKPGTISLAKNICMYIDLVNPETEVATRADQNSDSYFVSRAQETRRNLDNLKQEGSGLIVSMLIQRLSQKQRGGKLRAPVKIQKEVHNNNKEFTQIDVASKGRRALGSI